MNTEQAKQLRAAFKPEQIGKLPKGGTTLDYVGHAEVTDRLLEVDPDWTWRPTPPWPGFENVEGLFIELTVCGVTRPGFGEISGGFSPGDKIKSAIGDAIRNAAMRFGVALDLWMKDHEAPSDHRTPADTIRDKAKADRSEWTEPAKRNSNGAKPASEGQRKMIYAKCKAAGLQTVPDMVLALSGVLGRTVGSLEDLYNGEIDVIVGAGQEGLQAGRLKAMGLTVEPIGTTEMGLPILAEVTADDDPWAVEKW